MRRPLALALATAALSIGCEGHEFHPPDREAQVAEADSMFTAAMFDSITWEADSVRVQAGNLVYADECRRCHGPLGRGDTEYAASNELDVPSLVRPDWEYGEDLSAVRRRVYVGHPAGMPTWGIGRLEPRQIDAVSYYIIEQLRPEVLTTSPEIPGDG